MCSGTETIYSQVPLVVDLKMNTKILSRDLGTLFQFRYIFDNYAHYDWPNYYHTVLHLLYKIEVHKYPNLESLAPPFIRLDQPTF